MDCKKVKNLRNFEFIFIRNTFFLHFRTTSGSPRESVALSTPRKSSKVSYCDVSPLHFPDTPDGSFYGFTPGTRSFPLSLDLYPACAAWRRRARSRSTTRRYLSLRSPTEIFSLAFFRLFRDGHTPSDRTARSPLPSSRRDFRCGDLLPLVTRRLPRSDFVSVRPSSSSVVSAVAPSYILSSVARS